MWDEIWSEMKETKELYCLWLNMKYGVRNRFKFYLSSVPLRILRGEGGWKKTSVCGTTFVQPCSTRSVSSLCFSVIFFYIRSTIALLVPCFPSIPLLVRATFIWNAFESFLMCPFPSLPFPSLPFPSLMCPPQQNIY